MKSRMVLASLTLALGVLSSAAWGTRMLGTVVTGTVTAPVTGLKIEVDHQIYSITAGSPAAIQLQQFHSGDHVDLEFDGGVAGAKSQVVSVTKHIGS